MFECEVSSDDFAERLAEHNWKALFGTSSRFALFLECERYFKSSVFFYIPVVFLS
jgi:hypothetical protein